MSKLAQYLTTFENFSSREFALDYLIESARTNKCKHNIRTNQNRVRGCQYQLWVGKHERQVLVDSNGLIIRGLGIILADVVNTDQLKLAIADLHAITRFLPYRTIKSFQIMLNAVNNKLDYN